MLDQVRDFHGQLADYYHQLSESSDRQRVKLLLDHMSNHENQLQEGLRGYEEDASQQVMNTWIDCQFCDEVLATCKQIPISAETSVDSVVKATLDIDSCLIRFYREVADKVESENVRDVFQNLVGMEEAELRKLALSALQVGDM
jgi:hypothetical protein